MSPVAKPITERFWPRVNKAGPVHAVLGTPTGALQCQENPLQKRA